MANMVERYIWTAYLDDGNVVQEYPSREVHQSFAGIDPDRVVMLHLVPNFYLGIEGPTFKIDCSGDVRPVMFRRVILNTASNQETRYHVFGTEQTVNGETVRSLLYLSNDDGEAELSLDVVLTHGDLEGL